MTGFEPRTSGVSSDQSSNWATSTATCISWLSNRSITSPVLGSYSFKIMLTLLNRKLALNCWLCSRPFSYQLSLKRDCPYNSPPPVLKWPRIPPSSIDQTVNGEISKVNTSSCLSSLIRPEVKELPNKKQTRANGPITLHVASNISGQSCKCSMHVKYDDSIMLTGNFHLWLYSRIAIVEHL